MSDPGHLITLQRTLELYSQEKLRIQAELEGLERQVAHCRELIRTSDRACEAAMEEISKAISGRDR